MDQREMHGLGGIEMINYLKTLGKSKQICRKGLTSSSLQPCLWAGGWAGRKETRKLNICHKEDLLFTV